MDKLRNLSIAVKLGSIYVLIALLFVASYYVNRYANREEAKDGIITTIAGRNKMLSQKIALYAELIVAKDYKLQDQLQETIDMHDKAFRTLQTGGQNTEIGYEVKEFDLSPELLQVVDSVGALWKRYRENAQLIVDDPAMIAKEITTQEKDLLGETVEVKKVVTVPNPLVQNAIQFIEDYNQEMLDRNDMLVRTLVRKIIHRQNLLEVVQVILLILSIILVVFGIYMSYIHIVYIVRRLAGVMEKLANGEDIDKLDIKYYDEIGKLQLAFNGIVDKLDVIQNFVDNVRSGNFETNLDKKHQNDILIRKLTELRDDLKRARLEQESRVVEDKQRNWKNNGLTMFSDILRQNNDNIVLLGDTIVKAMVDYVDAVQGGLFVYNEEKSKDYVELLSSYAYGRKKFMDKKIPLGKGLVGACAIERNTMYLKKIPSEYFEVSSGLGSSRPKSVLITPLEMEGYLLGVLELASFNDFESHQIDLIEQVAKNIAVTMQTAQNNIRTVKLLEQSQMQAEDMQSQEKELRDTIKELRSMQEETTDKELEIKGTLHAIDNSAGMFEMDMNGMIIGANSHFVNTLELKRGEIVGHEHKDIIHPDDRNEAKSKEILKQLNIGETVSIQTRYMSKTGDEIWMQETYTPIKNKEDNYYKVLSLSVNITKSKQQEKQLQADAADLKMHEDIMRQNMEEMMEIQNEFEEKENKYVKQIQELKEKIKK